MSRILLISSNTARDPYPVYPLGMAVLASALAAKGHGVRQYDFLVTNQSERLLQKTLSEFEPDYVGISLRNIDNVDSFTSEDAWYLSSDRRLVELVRQASAATIILGGPAFSLLPEEILDYLGADYGVIGEGEEALGDLIDSVEKGHPVPNIVNGDSSAPMGQGFGAPLWKRELVDFYFKESGMLGIQTKRGCPYNCVYCTYPQLEGRKCRPRDIEDVLDEIRRLHQDYGVNTLFFTDSVFNDSGGIYLRFAEALLSRGPEVRWSAFFRPHGVGSKELKLLKRSGLYALEAGTDASSDKTLRGLGKSFRFDEVVRFNQACSELDLPIAHYVLFGGPEETFETLSEGLRNLERLENSIVFAFSGIRVLPKTALYDRAVREGVINKDVSLLRPVYYFSPGIDPQSMNRTIEQSFEGRHDRIFPPSEGLMRLAVMNRFGYRGILWDRMLQYAQRKP
jgi:lipid biosynthesis B12-binding/radical SAM protein